MFLKFLRFLTFLSLTGLSVCGRPNSVTELHGATEEHLQCSSTDHSFRLAGTLEAKWQQGVLKGPEKEEDRQFACLTSEVGWKCKEHGEGVLSGEAHTITITLRKSPLVSEGLLSDAKGSALDTMTCVNGIPGSGSTQDTAATTVEKHEESALQAFSRHHEVAARLEALFLAGMVANPPHGFLLRDGTGAMGREREFLIVQTASKEGPVLTTEVGVAAVVTVTASAAPVVAPLDAEALGARLSQLSATPLPQDVTTVFGLDAADPSDRAASAFRKDARVSARIAGRAAKGKLLLREVVRRCGWVGCQRMFLAVQTVAGGRADEGLDAVLALVLLSGADPTTAKVRVEGRQGGFFTFQK